LPNVFIWVNFGCFLAVFWPKKAKKCQKKAKKGQEMPKSKNSFFVEFSFVRKQCLEFVNFHHFISILAVFWPKKAQKCQNRKIFFCCILFCWEASTYQISENFIKRFGFGLCGEFSFTKRHLHTNFW